MHELTALIIALPQELNFKSDRIHYSFNLCLTSAVIRCALIGIVKSVECVYNLDTQHKIRVHTCVLHMLLA